PTDTDYILWDVKEGREKRRWPGARQTGRGVFAPDGRSVVLYDTILRRIDLETGKNLYAGVASRGHAGAVRRLFFAADGKQLVSVGDDQTACVWDVASAKLIRNVTLNQPDIEAWTVTPDASALIGIDSRLAVHHWSMHADRAPSTVILR